MMMTVEDLRICLDPTNLIQLKLVLLLMMNFSPGSLKKIQMASLS